MSDDIGTLVPIEMYARVLNRADRAEASHEQQVIVAANYAERAERAEAERDAMREALTELLILAEWYDRKYTDIGTPSNPRIIKARAALASSPAGPDGKSLAVLYCMDRAEEDVKLLREALEGMIAVSEGRFDGNPHADIDALAKARAALAPSPAGRDCGCEDASKCWGGSPGIKCRRPFPSPAGLEG